MTTQEQQREYLSKLYTEWVGYCPFEDCSSNTIKSVVETLLDYGLERLGQRYDRDTEIKVANLMVAAKANDLLRPAIPRDVKVGAVFYYPTRHKPYFQIVDSLWYSDDAFKGYVAEDGCRYGLDGAYVQKDSK